MQKKLIALAIAGLASGAAFADSANVTMYGVADVSFEQVTAGGVSPNALPVSTALDTSTRARLASNSSLIGFKGAESLGNGLTAVFQFESNVDLANATGLLGAKRDSYIGLAGAFGTVAAGYLSTPTRSLMVGTDVMPGSAGNGQINSIMGRLNVGATLSPLAASGVTGNNNASFAGIVANNQNTIFRTNAIAYISPNFSGFSGVLAYVPAGTFGNKDNVNGTTSGVGAVNANSADRNPSAWNLALNYANGPVKVGYAYLKASDADLLNAAASGANQTALIGLGYNTGTTLSSHTLAGSYDFGNGLMLSALYERIGVDLGTNANATRATVTSLDRNAFWLGAKYVTGPHEVAGSYASVGSNAVACWNGCVAGTNYGDSGASQWALRYAYNFSKRTQVYGLYTRVTNDKNGNFDLGNTVMSASTQAGADPQSWGLGMRHTF